jgi:hypothetical protein
MPDLGCTGPSSPKIGELAVSSESGRSFSDAAGYLDDVTVYADAEGIVGSSVCTVNRLSEFCGTVIGGGTLLDFERESLSDTTVVIAGSFQAAVSFGPVGDCCSKELR